MKISVLTPTYNRGDLIENLYKSLEKNAETCESDIEWLIMDDGSEDNTKDVIKTFDPTDKIQIKYYYQENHGKMYALNELVEHATGDLIVECDSDDYFTASAFKIIEEKYKKCKKRKDIYALCFLKNNQYMQNMGDRFKKEETTMFDLYFKEGETGEKALVFFANIRKKYKYELEENEKFITEARMYHKMDLDFKMICFNTPIMVCEYQEGGYSKNISKQFKANPIGYYKYFAEMFEHNFKGVKFKKRLYAIKHLILFKVLTDSKDTFKLVKGFKNKFLYIVLYIPGIIKSKKYKNNK